MRPIGVTAIAILSWLRASVYALGGLMLIGVGHLSARLVSAIASDSFLERLLSGVGKTIGIGALVIALGYIVVGFGLWRMKNWARALTLVIVSIGLLLGLLGLLRHPTPWHMFRVLVDVAILVYLMLPDVKRLFLAD
ncbi:MAG: DUF2127 domain-containing protein [Terriglobales bacterium]